MKLQDTFNFGKYKDFKLIEVWKGYQKPDVDILIKNYIIEVIDIIQCKRPFVKVPSPWKACMKELPPFEITESEIQTDGKTIIIKCEKNILEQQIKFLENFFSIIMLVPFNEDAFWKCPKSNNEELSYSENSKLLFLNQPNPGYVEWAIKNNHISLTQDTISSLRQTPSIHIYNFEIKKYGSNVLIISPIFYCFQYNLNIEKNSYKRIQEPRIEDYDLDSGYPQYCEACGESPCMCSDPGW